METIIAAPTALPEIAIDTTDVGVVFSAEAFAALSPWDGITDDTEPRLLSLIDLTSREGYLAWVKAWKAEYKACSARIRKARTAFRAAGAAGGPMSFAVKQPLLRNRALARTLLAARHAGKRESWARAQALHAGATEA